MVPPVEMSVIWRIGIRLCRIKADGSLTGLMAWFVWCLEVGYAGCEYKGSV